MDFGAIFGVVLRRLETSWGGSWGVLGAFWGCLGSVFGASWGRLGSSGCPGTLFVLLCGHFGPFLGALCDGFRIAFWDRFYIIFNLFWYRFQRSPEDGNHHHHVHHHHHHRIASATGSAAMAGGHSNIYIYIYIYMCSFVNSL